jgi:K+-transporting ATPase ATPase A chain
MDASGWNQFALFLIAVAAITKPMGLYLVQVLDANGRTWLDPVVRPLERLTYHFMGVNPSKEQMF